MRTSNRSRHRSIAGLVALALALVVRPLPAGAQSGVGVTTPYPDVTVEAGSTVRYELEVTAAGQQIVPLQPAGLPAGWNATLRGGGLVVSAVTATSTAPGKATLEVKVPENAEAKAHNFSLVSPALGVTLPLTVTVASQVDNGVEITADFPTLKGAPADTFTYNLTVTNNSPLAQTFTFEPTAPQGWTVTASAAAETRSPTVTIEAGQTGRARIEAKPPATIDAGEYPIGVAVTTASGQRGEITLGAEVSGAAALTFAPANERLDLDSRAGGSSTKAFTLTNTGTAELTDVSFSSSPPTDWKVTFAPDKVERLEPGASTTVTVRIEPSARAIAGDYSVEASARAGSLDQSQALRVTVETSRWWGFAGIAVIVAALAGLFGVYRRFGRR